MDQREHLLHIVNYTKQIETQEYIERLYERYDDERNLLRFGHQMYSQNLEDGLLAEIFRRIGTTNKSFVEIGSGDGIECNSHFLLIQAWHGHWFDGNPEEVDKAKVSHALSVNRGTLTISNDFVIAKNVEMLLHLVNTPKELDFLSIDVDGQDYWIWEAITVYQPRVVMIEYNASLGPDVELVMRPNSKHVWEGGNGYGASLRALEKLGARKGYQLVVCDVTGTNAIFVRKDLAGEKFDDCDHYQPARYYLVTHWGHKKAVGEWVVPQDLPIKDEQPPQTT